MKKHFLLLALLSGFSAFLGTSASAACQEIQFPDGQKFCFDIQKLSSERFQARTSAMQVNSPSELSCKLKLPNGTQVALPRCEGEFNYGGNNGTIELRADISNYWYELIANYDFQNGNFGNSTSTYTSNYQPEITTVSTDKPEIDQWIDIGVRVKNTTYSTSYNDDITFRIEQYKNGRRESASSYNYNLERTSYTFSSYENGEKKFDRLVKFRTEGEFRLYVEAEGGNSTYETFTVRNNNNSTTSKYYPEWFSVSDTTPDQDEWVDMTLRIKKDGYSTAYNGRVDFQVEEYRNGGRTSASSYDYQLDKTSYYFSSSDQGEIRLKSFVKFMNSGEFRVIAKLRDNGNESTYKTFTVGTNSNSYYTADSLSIRSFYPSTPRVDDWVDITVRAIDRYGSRVTDYDSRIRFEVEEYRNGYRRTANSADFDLDMRSYSFSRYENGEKTFSDAIRFRTSGEYRIKAIDENQTSIYGTREITVNYSNYDNNSNNYSNFTDKELSKIRAVVNIWNDVIIALEKDYPRLRNSYEWKRLSNNFYANMQDILRNPNNAKLKDWKMFYSAFQEWFSFTVRTR